MSAAVAAAMRDRNPEVHQAGRELERMLIVALIRARGLSARKLAKHGRLTTEDATRLSRWLEALAGDVEAELHDMELD